jgi:hypothetical protein
MNKPSILGYLSHQLITPAIKKGFFSGEYVFFGQYLTLANFLYETCSVLGYTFRDRLLIFLELMSEDGRQVDLLNWISTPAIKRLSEIPTEPKSFYELFYEPEHARLMKQYHNANPTKYSDSDDFTKVYKRKMPVNAAMTNLQFAAAEGIGFGYTYPDLTEKLLSYVHDPSEWNSAYKYGLDIGPKPPEMVPLSTLVSNARTLITPFVEKVRPDLIEKLGLSK